MKITYADGIRLGFEYLLKNYSNVFAIGQGVWSPWYVGASMKDLDKNFGHGRVIDTPVSENAVTGLCVGAALNGMRPICIHPRIDFAILCFDQLVNEAAKWRHMFGGQVKVPMVARLIINRGGEQGAQHSQALQSWLAHVPGLRVVMPYSPNDARDLLIASTLCDDPVVYIDDRWLYEIEEEEQPIVEKSLVNEQPKCIREGKDITLVGSSYSTHLCKQVAEKISDRISCEVIDLRILNPMNLDIVADSVKKTGRLMIVDGGWSSCGIASEVITKTLELINDASVLKTTPIRITLTDAPAPTSKYLEGFYYPGVGILSQRLFEVFQKI